jgi:hypothetical protein
VGFRSALHAWRPIVTAVAGHSLVEGFALPGEDVIVSVKRAGVVPAAAEASGDPQTGGFVSTLEDAAGHPFAIQPGDRVSVRTGGRQATVRVDALLVRVHAGSVSGTARPGSTVPISVVARGATSVWHTLATASSGGTFSVAGPSSLPAGSLAVASVTDAAGDQVSASSHVPGFIVDETGRSLTGWATGVNPDVQVWRNGKLVFRKRVQPPTVCTTSCFRRLAGRRACRQGIRSVWDRGGIDIDCRLRLCVHIWRWARGERSSRVLAERPLMRWCSTPPAPPHGI